MLIYQNSSVEYINTNAHNKQDVQITKLVYKTKKK